LISGWTWDDWGAGWTFSLGSVFELAGFLLIYRWVGEDAVSQGEAVPGAVDARKPEKTPDPVQ
jgi:PPP family 3-phenylpropionic acid transporter